MSEKPHLITYAKAAIEKDCSHQTLRDAAEKGLLNETEILGRKALIVNDLYRSWEVKEWGGRIAKHKNGQRGKSKQS